MAKRRVKKTKTQPASSPARNIYGTDPREHPDEEKEDAFRDQEVECQSASIRTIRDVETERLLTGLCLLRSFFSEAQLQTPVVQFFKESLPNVSVVRNGQNGQFEVQWSDKDGNLSMNQAAGRSIRAPLHQMSTAYLDYTAAMPLGGLDISSKTVKASLFGAENLQVKDFVLKEPSYTQMLGLQDGLQTPGLSSQRLSVGMTPKSQRPPKHGEMLLSVHGSPLGVYQEDIMEAINESEEG